MNINVSQGTRCAHPSMSLHFAEDTGTMKTRILLKSYSQHQPDSTAKASPASCIPVPPKHGISGQVLIPGLKIKRFEA